MTLRIWRGERPKLHSPRSGRQFANRRTAALLDQRRVLPMELQIGDRLSDETGEWEVIGRAYTTGGGKNAHARLQLVGDPDVHEIRSWSAHERIVVKRTTAEEGKG